MTNNYSSNSNLQTFKLTTASELCNEGFWVLHRVSSIPDLQCCCLTDPTRWRCSSPMPVLLRAQCSTCVWGRTDSGWNGGDKNYYSYICVFLWHRATPWNWPTWVSWDGCRDCTPVQMKYDRPPGLPGCSDWGWALLAQLPASQFLWCPHCRAARLNSAPWQNTGNCRWWFHILKHFSREEELVSNRWSFEAIYETCVERKTLFLLELLKATPCMHSFREDC